MKIGFDSIEESCLPEFMGGQKQYNAKMFFDGTNRVMKGRLIPGASIGLHTHSGSSEFMFFTSGRGYVLYDGERIDLKPGDVHYCPKGHAHTLVNDGDEDLCFDAVVAAQ